MLTHGELWDLFGRREWEAIEQRFVHGTPPSAPEAGKES